jgi:hypothetical protein
MLVLCLRQIGNRSFGSVGCQIVHMHALLFVICVGVIIALVAQHVK